MPQGSVRLAILTNEIAVDGVQLALAERESELLTLLCLCGGYADADALAAQLWPAYERREAVMALFVAANALRRALPDSAMLRAERCGYGLDASISVDLWQIDEYLRAHRCATRSRCAIDERLYRRLTAFHCTHRYRIARWRWAQPLRALIERYRRDAGLWLGWGLLAEDRVYEAHGVANELLAADPSSASVRGLFAAVERRLVAFYLPTIAKAG